MLMIPQSEVPGIRTGHAAVWMVDGGPPLVAEESCREHLGVAPCDRRHPTAVHMSDFPGVSFDRVSFLVCSGHAGCLLSIQAAIGKRAGLARRAGDLRGRCSLDGKPVADGCSCTVCTGQGYCS